MLCASALAAAKPAASPSGVVKTRGAMACRPDVDPVLIHHGSHAWVEHATASAARRTTQRHASCRLRCTT
jgi:hypothetical protein